ncbi:MAG: type II toxin-antitoxin system RelE/ParE family toxin [Paenibacillus macerans]|uniref:Plasmid stabilization system family protein n=1 Tax=Paenibacillus macerans TaxID=44252 RepID=A0A090ZKJ8_PAEMA|nr:type II toxin-antitoxin system RelE/ParE family toxin [Paenibacillus macerans]KFN10795.1 plasmid stabilization system family protein [Paenibacillus macerans]MBS5914093.1 type II toxin-antitoxin system RelE/ParE family toxin [Paenibacillus macerans]MCY7561748.1 type II toxin-antitoxin system RelE/ParE family toxin [Paenibacillus macerans]MDU7475056.1 type II toxin-antitoxin system RelE/ParE family toxin [Paenibacillus macerans]MEC0137679.1 type II toxin-antitoxin system RelE/ParE family toxi
MDKKYKIEYLPIAEEDLSEIIQYIMLDNPDAAFLMANKLDQTISILEIFPNNKSIPNDLRLQALNYRMLIVDPYIVFCVVNDETVEIRRILHGKRKYNFLF